MMNSQMTNVQREYLIIDSTQYTQVTERYNSGIRNFIDSLYNNCNSKCPSSAHNDDNDGRGGESAAECWLASPHHGEHSTALAVADPRQLSSCMLLLQTGGGGGGRDALSPGMWHRQHQPGLTIAAFLALLNNIKPDLIQLFVLTKPQLSRSPEYAALHI